MSQDGAQEQGRARGRYAGRSLAQGRYQLRDLLGEGGMASVHLAYDSVLDRQVAIKTLHTELAREQSFRERFRREAQAVAKLAHTNIVSVFDTGEEAPSADASGEGGGAPMPYIVMEYVEGLPLRSVLDEDVRQHGAMPADKALKITADVLAALEVSHEMGLVHRDIKPGNVMVTKRGVVKVMDFGIARAMQSGVTSMTQTGMVVGTPQYLSPEQALGRGVDARSDLYSVGIMLFELLTGRLPFDADSPLAIAYAHVQEEPETPSAINRSVPAAADALVARALKKNPNERFPTAEAMRDECLRVAGSGQSGATPLVIGEGPRAHSGAAVAAAVFPPVSGDPGTPVPNVQTPYQPVGPYGPGGYGPSTPPPASGHGHGPVQQGYPGAYGHGAHTPPPYTISPSAAGQGGGKGGMRVVWGAVAAAVAAVAVLIGVIAYEQAQDDGKQTTSPRDPGGQEGTDGGSATGGQGGDTDEGTGDDTGDDTGDGTDGGTGDGAFNPGDKTKTIDKEKCTDAYEHYQDKSKVLAPDLTYKDIGSVKQCLQAAGWKYEVEEEDENVWGQGIVLRQTPSVSDPFDPKDESAKFVLTVSTGKPE